MISLPNVHTEAWRDFERRWGKRAKDGDGMVEFCPIVEAWNVMVAEAKRRHNLEKHDGDR